MSEVTFNSVAAEIGALVTEKNAAYGDSFAKCGDFLRLLFPNGITPAQYGDALAMVRIFDKQMRIATRKDAFGESPYRDICGYGLLGAVKDAAALTSTAIVKAWEGRTKATMPPPDSLCNHCAQGCQPRGDVPNNINACEAFKPLHSPPADPWAERDLCRRCGRESCASAGKMRLVPTCERYEPKVEK